jgi:GMP synthase (glutamine-hydrolysing)
MQSRRHGRGGRHSGDFGIGSPNRRPDLLLITHVPWEGPGTIEKAAARHGFELVEISAPHLVKGDTLASAYDKAAGLGSDSSAGEPGETGRALDPARLCGLVVMGGPMSVYDKASNPWISAELALIEEALESGLSVLGVCLGAQMLAAALGSQVYRGEQGEEAARHQALGTVCGPDGRPTEIPVFHWHGDTFDIPSGCDRLAESDLYPNQAFSAGASVLGLQFHIELDAELWQQWTPHLPESFHLGAKSGPSWSQPGGPEVEAAIDDGRLLGGAMPHTGTEVGAAPGDGSLPAGDDVLDRGHEVETPMARIGEIGTVGTRILDAYFGWVSSPVES